MGSRAWVATLAMAALLQAACASERADSTDGTDAVDGGAVDGVGNDGGVQDASDDTAATDTAATDTAAADTAATDTAATDTAATDTAPKDTASTDAASTDTAPTDTASTDTAPTDVATDVASDTSADTTADAGGTGPQLPPTGADALPWLQANSYAAWKAEPSKHASAGPHFGAVRTFFNDALHASLKGGASAHPVGAAAVKELYGSGSKVIGWAVMRKTKDGQGGKGWYWYEWYQGQKFADAEGTALCTGCHVPGKDYVLSKAP